MVMDSTVLVSFTPVIVTFWELSWFDTSPSSWALAAEINVQSQPESNIAKTSVC